MAAYARRGIVHDERPPSDDWGYINEASFVETFGNLWLSGNGPCTVTQSYENDLIEYPGLWDHDIPVYLRERERADRKVENTLRELEKDKQLR